MEASQNFLEFQIPLKNFLETFQNSRFLSKTFQKLSRILDSPPKLPNGPFPFKTDSRGFAHQCKSNIKKTLSSGWAWDQPVQKSKTDQRFQQSWVFFFFRPNPTTLLNLLKLVFFVGILKLGSVFVDHSTFASSAVAALFFLKRLQKPLLCIPYH